MKTVIVARHTKTVLQTAAFLVALLSTTALPILWNPSTALATSNSYPTSIAGCKAVVPPPNGTFTCDLKGSTQDLYYDPWLEENRECTSYAAWMLSSVNGFTMPFNDDAVNWGTRATGLGYTVNMTPKVGSIYWSSSSDHVAWVEAVSADGTTVNTLDYNSGFPTNPGLWAEHIGLATSSASGYIHFKDLVTDTDGDGVPDTVDVAPTIPGPVNNRGIPDFSSRVTGDFNGDGKADLAVFYTYPNDQVKLFEFLATGSGYAAPTVAWDSGVGNWVGANNKPFAGDFNGDGKTDVGVFYSYPNSQTKLFTFLANASGGFNAPTQAWDSGVGNWDWSRTLQVAGDFNGDGKTDVGVFYDYGNSQTKLLTFLANSTGFNTPTLAWDSGVNGWNWANMKPVAGDFNGDGKKDIGVFYGYPNSQTKLFTFLANASGFNTPTLAWDSGVGNWDWSRVLQVGGDFSGDGKGDIGVFYDYGNNQTKLITFLANANGTGFNAQTVWDSGVGNWSWASVNIP